MGFLAITGGFKRAFTIDYRSLALFRVFIATIVLTDLCFRAQYFTAFFTDQGILPRTVVVNWFGDASYSLYFISGSTFFSVLLYSISILAALAMMFGYRTRVATAMTWLLVLSLHHRTSMLSSGADDLMRLLLFWAMFLPLGARYSVDAATDKANIYTEDGRFNFATIAILMQVLYVYWVGALLKSHSDWHTDFTAVYYALNSEEYANTLGIWFAEYFASLLPYVTQFIYHLELFGPLFLVSPLLLLWLRIPALALLILMHIGFLLLLNVGHFPYVSICSLLLFLPKEFWDRISAISWFRRDQGVTVFYDQNCDFCLKTVLLLKQLCLLPSIRVLPAQENQLAASILEQNDSWVLQKPDGKTLIEWPALTYFISLSPILFWISWPLRLTTKLNIGNRLYHFIGDRRVFLGRFTTKAIPWTESQASSSKLSHMAVSVFMIFCFYINMQGLLPNKLPPEPAAASHVKYMLGLWQKWDMFAPQPAQQTRWPIFEGITNNGDRIDVFRHLEGAASSEKPAHILSDYDYYRWRKYFERLYLRRYAYLRQHYVNYECSSWNRGKAYGDQIKEITLKMGTEVTLLDPAAETQFDEWMGTYSC